MPATGRPVSPDHAAFKIIPGSWDHALKPEHCSGMGGMGSDAIGSVARWGVSWQRSWCAAPIGGMYPQEPPGATLTAWRAHPHKSTPRSWQGFQQVRARMRRVTVRAILASRAMIRRMPVVAWNALPVFPVCESQTCKGKATPAATRPLPADTSSQVTGSRAKLCHPFTLRMILACQDPTRSDLGKRNRARVRFRSIPALCLRE